MNRKKIIKEIEHLIKMTEGELEYKLKELRKESTYIAYRMNLLISDIDYKGIDIEGIGAEAYTLNKDKFIKDLIAFEHLQENYKLFKKMRDIF